MSRQVTSLLSKHVAMRLTHSKVDHHEAAEHDGMAPSSHAPSSMFTGCARLTAAPCVQGW